MAEDEPVGGVLLGRGGGRQGQQGGIVKAEGAMYSSKVMPVCPKCSKPTRVGHSFNKDGKKNRVCKRCGAEF